MKKDKIAGTKIGIICGLILIVLGVFQISKQDNMLGFISLIFGLILTAILIFRLTEFKSHSNSKNS